MFFPFPGTISQHDVGRGEGPEKDRDTCRCSTAITLCRDVGRGVQCPIQKGAQIPACDERHCHLDGSQVRKRLPHLEVRKWSPVLLGPVLLWARSGSGVSPFGPRPLTSNRPGSQGRMRWRGTNGAPRHGPVVEGLSAFGVTSVHLRTHTAEKCGQSGLHLPHQFKQRQPVPPPWLHRTQERKADHSNPPRRCRHKHHPNARMPL